MVQAIGRAYRWREQLLGEQLTVKQLAARQGVASSLIHKYLPLTCLGPSVLKMALRGDLPLSVSLERLIQAGSLLDWSEQASLLGLDHAGVRPAGEAPG